MAIHLRCSSGNKHAVRRPTSEAQRRTLTKRYNSVSQWCIVVIQVICVQMILYKEKVETRISNCPKIQTWDPWQLQVRWIEKAYRRGEVFKEEKKNSEENQKYTVSWWSKKDSVSEEKEKLRGKLRWRFRYKHRGHWES